MSHHLPVRVARMSWASASLSWNLSVRFPSLLGAYSLPPTFNGNQLIINTFRERSGLIHSERAETLSAFALNAARLEFEEGVKDSIEQGKLADLVVLSEEPLMVPPERLREIDVWATIMADSIAYTGM